MAAVGCRRTAKDPESDSAEPPSAQASEDGPRNPNASLEDSLKGVDWSVKTLDRKRDYSGTLTIFFENDTFANQRDSHFTAGFGAMWTTAPVRTLSPNNMFRRLAEDSWSFLPTVSDRSYEKFFQFGGGWEIYTPADISAVISLWS